MSNEKLCVDKIVEVMDKYLPAEINPISIMFGLWKLTMDFKIEMLKQEGYSDEFIDKWIERQCDSFAKELIKEREA